MVADSIDSHLNGFLKPLPQNDCYLFEQENMETQTCHPFACCGLVVLDQAIPCIAATS
jgi:hypothetical protein